jgi:hypothetical protein
VNVRTGRGSCVRTVSSLLSVNGDVLKGVSGESKGKLSFDREKRSLKSGML